MSDILETDIKFIEDKRKDLNLPKPQDFEEGRIKPEDIEKLLELVKLPFKEGSTSNSYTGYSSKGIKYLLQLNRLQQIFGNTHIKIEHKVIDKKLVESKDPNKNDMYYYKTYVEIQIGNYTLYTDSDNIPKTNFVSYYTVEGIGWGKAVDEGTAEKNSKTNGIKDVCKYMGMLRDIYLQDNDDSDSNYNEGLQGEIQLLSQPNIYPSGTIYLKSTAKDINKNKNIEIIIYRNNNYNEKEHKSMIQMLEKNRTHLIKGKNLKVNYLENKYQNREQYIIQKIN
ncbi:hypothetical protein [Senegalia massiliensis]|uniref:Uncharacterized protein n=1 Tax=Senegalia massiliensis TaxID=1720316 RepID=A0A845R0A0_9CLOT|nr:hypothetical protein [Senegalia massiliensis]NBI07644.1 hypothetical protein [Senegalia massiliensis]